MQSHPVLAEFGPSSLKVLDGTDGLELSLERADNGRLTADCIGRLVESLRVFLRNRSGSGRRVVHCAIGARGVSLRRLTLPRAGKGELERLIVLQIEREFPLSPDELAWGWFAAGHAGDAAPAAGGGTDIVVAAIKRELLQQYDEVLAGAGLTPVFTVAALVRQFALEQLPASCAILDIGRAGSELAVYSQGIPVQLHTIPFGGDSITGAIAKRLGVSRADADRLKLELHNPSAPVVDAAARQSAREVLAVELAELAGLIHKSWVSGRLYLCGGSACLDGLPEAVSRAVGPGSPCERMRTPSGDARSAAILGMQRHHAKGGGEPPLVLKMAAVASPSAAAAGGAAWKWIALAALLALACLALRHAEPFLFRAKVTGRLAELRQRKAQLPQIDRELGFLQHLRTNQPPYLELIHTFAKSAPPGTRLTSVALSRRGDLSLRATLGGSGQVSGFRSNLVESGLFASVVVDEQTPAPEGRGEGVTVRITGQRGDGSAIASKAAPVTPAAPAPGAPGAPKPAGNLPPPVNPPPAVLADRPAGASPPALAGTNAGPVLPTNAH